MNQGPGLRRRSWPAAVLLGAALLLGGTAATADAQAPAPQLGIAVDDGSASTTRGDRLDYTITVTNLGARRISDLHVSQTVPTGAAFVSADLEGRHAGGTVVWSVDLDATEKTTLHTTMTVGATQDSALRLATVACAQTSAKAPPLVCASDSDQLPAGAVAEQARAGAASVTGTQPGRTPWYAAGVAGAALAAAAAAVLVVRRRRSAPVPVGARSAVRE